MPRVVLRWEADDGIAPVREVAYLGELEVGAIFDDPDGRLGKKGARWASFLGDLTFWKNERTRAKAVAALTEEIEGWLLLAGLEQTSASIREALGGSPAPAPPPHQVEPGLPLFDRPKR